VSTQVADRQVADYAYLDDLSIEVGEDAEDAVPPFADSVVAMQGASLDGEDSRQPEPDVLD
jgi:hypothetical protein